MAHLGALHVPPGLCVHDVDTNEWVDELQFFCEHGDAVDCEAERVGGAAAIDAAPGPSSGRLQSIARPEPQLPQKHSLPDTAIVIWPRRSLGRVILGHSERRFF